MKFLQISCTAMSHTRTYTAQHFEGDIRSGLYKLHALRFLLNQLIRFIDRTLEIAVANPFFIAAIEPIPR